jgi:dTDP-4-dehydrorhamnose 3,5-epimerase
VKILDELLPGCLLLEPKSVKDSRGQFVKTYHEGEFKTAGLNIEIKEEYYSVSHKNVIRGMHFQRPPFAHDKLVHCINGSALDVLLDLRCGRSYGRVATTELTSENQRLIFIPKGVAHGFAALIENTVMLYKTSTVYKPEADLGIRWDSFGFNWRVVDPIISHRDLQHVVFSNFITEFKL